MTGTVFITFVVTLIVLFVVYQVWCHHFYCVNTDVPVISYKEFKAVFAVAPRKWRKIKEQTLGYDDGKKEHLVRIKELTGYIRALRDIKKDESSRLNEEAQANKKELINYWQRDIEEYKTKAFNDFKKQLQGTGITLFSKEQEEIIKAAVKEVCKELGSEKANKAAEEAVRTIEIKTIASA